ncbi:glycosyl transferase family protein [Ramlibacter pallidus]|uniref:Glycosyl transferase family protein n=1 Tax=Ramlibacter pallidus TaxID=2780087 RepID=A0ABR9S2M4_9BURK|nr:glycosyl transferase family protein [Ramlibacter pallidus]MBE7367750.1 glycosyl transferase family protein [Ramlibacter pallidus]
MNWDLMIAEYNSGLEVLAAILTLVIFVSSLDDLFIDLWYWVRRIFRRARLERTPQYRRLTVEQLRDREEQPLAIMVPAWQESDVIAAMVQNMVEVLEYRNYRVFVGTYPNDQPTIDEVERMVKRYPQLQRVQVPHPGPTSKADCLNAVVAAIFEHEREHGVEFAGVALHDSEDVLHPLELKFFNYLLPRKDMIQLPVASLEREWYELVAGTYMDEFAESHAKEMVVRESVSGMVPSAGVGTCFSRKALLALIGSTRNKPFNIDSLTEDYDVGMRLAQLNMTSIFGVFPVTFHISRTSWGSKKRRELLMQMPLCVREYFPDNFRAAYRQKARWVLGIGLQSWEQIKWRGQSLAARYLLLHDRKGVVTSFVSILAYILVAHFILFHVGLATGWWHAYYPSLFQEGSIWRAMIYVNAFFLAIRAAHRVYFTSALYGWEHGVMSLPRMVVGNFVNCMAVARAWKMYLGYLFKGNRLAWDKTAHEFPSSTQLARRRQRLGELLQSWNAVEPGALERALEKQQSGGVPLGRVLVSNGWLDEETLAEAIAYQADLPRAHLSAELVRQHAADMPLELAVRHRAVHMGRNKNGRPILAVTSPLSEMALADITQAIGQEPVQRIAREGELAVALRLLRETQGEKATAVPSGPLLGDMLIERGLLRKDEFEHAMQEYKPNQHGRIGDYLVERGVIAREMLEQVVQEQRSFFARAAAQPEQQQRGFFGKPSAQPT